MTMRFPNYRLVSAGEMSAAVDYILTRRHAKACTSEYDVMVCVRSVAAARKAFESITVDGGAIIYGRAIETAIDRLAEDYHDSDGEFTSKGMIGDIRLEIYGLLDSQETPELIDIDRKEAEECLMAEMQALVSILPDTVDAADIMTIKTTVIGASGHKYFVKMTLEQASSDKIALLGHLYSNNSYQFPILDERLERNLVERE